MTEEGVIPLSYCHSRESGNLWVSLQELDEIPRSSRGMTNERMSFPRKPCPRLDRGHAPDLIGGLSPRKRGLVPAKAGTGIYKSIYKLSISTNLVFPFLFVRLFLLFFHYTHQLNLEVHLWLGICHLL